jgi:hypothetical protein
VTTEIKALEGYENASIDGLVLKKVIGRNPVHGCMVRITFCAAGLLCPFSTQEAASTVWSFQLRQLEKIGA